MSQVFKKILQDAGVPMTTEALQEQWRQELKDSGSNINNDSAYSPFWRIVTELITKPVLYLVDVLATKLMPGFYLQTATGTALDTLVNDNYATQRRQASKTQGTLLFTRLTGGDGFTLPKGSMVKTAPLNGVEYMLATDEDATFQYDQKQMQVRVTATVEGTNHNLPGGFFVVMNTPIDGVSISHGDDWIVKLGHDLETDEPLRYRAKANYNTLSSYHTDGVYQAIISDFAGVDPRGIWFEHDAPRGPATANAYVLFGYGIHASPVLSAINKHISNGYHGLGDDLQVFEMPVTSHNLVTTLHFSSGLEMVEKDAVKTQVTNLIKAAFRMAESSKVITMAQPFSRFSFSRLGQELHSQIQGLDSIEFDQQDIVSDWAVPRLNKLTLQDGAHV